MTQAYFTGSARAGNHHDSESGEGFVAKAASLGRNAASELCGTVRGALGSVGQSVESALSSIGATTSSAAETLRSKSPEFASSTAECVAGVMEASGDYLQEKTLSDMSDDVAYVIKENPLRSVAVGFGVGLILGAVLRRR